MSYLLFLKGSAKPVLVTENPVICNVLKQSLKLYPVMFLKVSKGLNLCKSIETED